MGELTRIGDEVTRQLERLVELERLRMQLQRLERDNLLLAEQNAQLRRSQAGVVPQSLDAWRADE